MKKEISLEKFYSRSDKKAKFRIVEPKNDGKLYYPHILTQSESESDEAFEERAIKDFDEYIERRKVGEKGRKIVKTTIIDTNN